MLHHMTTILVCYGGNFESSSVLGKIWFPSRLWCCKLISVVGEPCYDPSDHIISCYYYYYYSSSSPNELVRPNSQRLMIRSLLNFTGRWIPISRVLQWKPWTYVKIFDLTYIGNRQRDFYKTWHTGYKTLMKIYVDKLCKYS